MVSLDAGSGVTEASEMISGCSAMGRMKIEALGAQLGSEIRLTITLDLPGKYPRPVEMEVYIPREFEIIHSDLPIDRDENHAIVRWAALQHRHQEWSIRFRPMNAGLYRLYGNLKVPQEDPSVLRPVLEELADNNPNFTGVDTLSQRRRKEFIESGKGLQMLQAIHVFSPKSIYFKVDAHGARIENWDFRTFGKRFRHWWTGGEQCP